MIENENVIVLEDSEGNELKFEHLDTLEIDKKTYIVCVSVESEENETEEVIIFEPSKDDEDDDVLLQVEDEEILDKVYQVFKENNSDIFDFED